MAIDSIAIDHALQAIGVIVGITSAVIGLTCWLALRWINTMCDSVKELRTEFKEFIKEYYDRHEDTMKKPDCSAKHAVLDNKVDKLHERVDAMEMDRR